MKKLLISALFLATFSPPALAADCIEKACIDVYTQDGKIIIEGRKGSGPSVKKSVAPAPSVTRKAIIRKPARPKPASTGTSKPKVITSTKKPIIRKKPTPVASTSSTSLNDKLVEMLPTAGISYSPSFQPLVKVPIFLWTDVPEIVTKNVEIVGEQVEVSLKPTFFWHYGDGTFFVTRKFGAPFPDGEIQHTYSKPGHYLIELITSWDGDFTVAGVKTRIPGEVKSVSILPITIVAAPTRFSPPVSYIR